MMDDMGQDDLEIESNEPLLKNLQELADHIDQARFPGQAWTASKASPLRQRHTLWFVAPGAALAASVLLGVMLWHRPAGTGPGNAQGPLASLPVEGARAQTQPALRQQATFLDIGVLARVTLAVPDMNLPVGSVALPSVGSRLTGPDSYTWNIPEICFPSL